MDVRQPTPETLATFLKIIDTIKFVRPDFLVYGGEYSPFDAFHALPDQCPSCGQLSMYCCFSGPLGGGSSITENYLHVCTDCRYNQFKHRWYTYDGSEWADCCCDICSFQYGELQPQPGEWRISEFGLKAYAALSTTQLQELLTKSINPRTAEIIRQEIGSRVESDMAPPGN